MVWICLKVKHIYAGRELLYMLLGIVTAAANLIFLILYITGANSFPRPLNAAEEKLCLQKLKNGDMSARDTLINRNLRLVAHIIKKYYSSYGDQDDLISIGTIGLIKAVDSFNGDKGTRLATYAARCIENEILMYFRNLKKISLEVSINDTIDTDKDGNALTLMDVISCDDTILETIDEKMKIEKLKGYMEKALDEREKKVIRLRYGLCGTPPLTQRETAKLLKISRSYVSRIEKKALMILKTMLEDK